MGPRAVRPAARRDHGDRRRLSAQPLPRPARLRVQCVARLRAYVSNADAGHARRHTGAPVPGLYGYREAGPEGRGDGLSLERAKRPARQDGQPGARVPPDASTRDSHALRRVVRRHRGGGLTLPDIPFSVAMERGDVPNTAKTPFTSVGNSAGSPAPIHRPSPATDHDPEMLEV